MPRGPTTSITRLFTFDAGHRVFGHEGKCRHLHGHTYKAEVTVQHGFGHPDKLDQLGRVVDFSVLKDKVGKWIEDNWDHNLLLNTEDPLYRMYVEEWYAWEKKIDPPQITVRDGRQMLLTNTSGGTRLEGVQDTVFAGRQPYWFLNGNPTAEAIARALFFKVEELLGGQDIHPVKVRVWETPNCYADYDDFDHAYELNLVDREEGE